MSPIPRRCQDAYHKKIFAGRRGMAVQQDDTADIARRNILWKRFRGVHTGIGIRETDKEQRSDEFLDHQKVKKAIIVRSCTCTCM